MFEEHLRLSPLQAVSCPSPARPAGTSAAKSQWEVTRAKCPQKAQSGWTCSKGHAQRDTWRTGALPWGWLGVPQLTEPAVPQCCLRRLGADAWPHRGGCLQPCPCRGGSSVRPSLGSSAWRQHSLPYLGGKSGAGSAAWRGIRVPFTLAALLWSRLPPSPSAREGELWPWGGLGGQHRLPPQIPWGGSISPCNPCVDTGRDGGCQDGALWLHATGPPRPGWLLRPDPALWPCTGAVHSAAWAPGCARLPVEPGRLR